MSEVVGVRFRERERLKYFDPQGRKYKKGEIVVTESSKAQNCGKVEVENREISDDSLTESLDKIIRPAGQEDLKKLRQNQKRAREAKRIFLKKVKMHKLDMKLVDAECMFAGNKILFYFTADGRVDFRSLVKDLAAALHARIELRQIGVRDESRMIGGLGACGKPFCCSTFLDDFHSVSIRMAKDQGLSLNPTKISGTCGRLMCCLKFEQEAYQDLLGKVPKIGAIVDTEEGRGTVIENNLISKTLRIRLHKKPDAVPLTVKADEVKLVQDGKMKNYEIDDSVLKELER